VSGAISADMMDGDVLVFDRMIDTKLIFFVIEASKCSLKVYVWMCGMWICVWMCVYVSGAV
jgi:hypothetical protein